MRLNRDEVMAPSLSIQEIQIESSGGLCELLVRREGVLGPTLDH